MYVLYDLETGFFDSFNSQENFLNFLKASQDRKYVIIMLSGKYSPQELGVKIDSLRVEIERQIRVVL